MNKPTPELLEQLQIQLEVMGEVADAIEETHGLVALYIRNQVKIANEAIKETDGGNE